MYLTNEQIDVKISMSKREKAILNTRKETTMKKNIFTIVFCMAGSAAICWLCDWRTKVVAWMLIFWVVIAVGVAGATLSEQIRAKKNNRR